MSFLHLAGQSQETAVSQKTASREVNRAVVRPQLTTIKPAGLIFPWLKYQLTLKRDESSSSYFRGLKLDGELSKAKSLSMNCYHNSLDRSPDTLTNFTQVKCVCVQE